MKLKDIAQQLNCELRGDGELDIQRVAGIEEAQAGDLTFVSNPKYGPKARTTQASAVIVGEKFPDIAAATLRTKNPYLAFAKAVELFYEVPAPLPGMDAAA